MLNKNGSATVAVALFLVIATGGRTNATAQARPSPEASGWTLRVTVYDGNPANKRIAPGAAVALASATLPVRTIETNSEGQAIFSGVAAGTYNLGVAAPGCNVVTAPVQVPTVLNMTVALECRPTQTPRTPNPDAQMERPLPQPSPATSSLDKPPSANLVDKPPSASVGKPSALSERLRPLATRPIAGRSTSAGFRYVTAGRVELIGRARPERSPTSPKVSIKSKSQAPSAVAIQRAPTGSVFIMGEVRAPGKYDFTGELTLLEALARAGSTTATASKELILLHRTDKQLDMIRLRLKDLEPTPGAHKIYLRDGDTIFVPKAEIVFVYGYVRDPGAYPMEPGMTVIQALAQAGGLTEQAAEGRITINRQVDGKLQEISARLTDVIQPGDTIQVPQRYF